MEVINFFANFGREESALHDMGGKSSGDRVNEGETASKEKKVSFLTRQSSTKLINDEIVHPFVAPVNEDGVPRYSPKSLVKEKPSSFSTISMLWGAMQEEKKTLGLKLLIF